jgi:arsenate reductase (thioredoxin)
MVEREPYAVLFLCTGNSARSILAESILNRIGRGRFKGYSAGSTPTGTVNPHAVKLLQSLGYPTEGLRSKSWDEFAAPDAPTLDFIVTVCDNAAGEVCPIWPGRPVRAHWGVPDPAAAEGNEAEIALAFADAYRVLRNRIELFVGLPLDKLDALSLKRRMDDIGETSGQPERA